MKKTKAVYFLTLVSVAALTVAGNDLSARGARAARAAAAATPDPSVTHLTQLYNQLSATYTQLNSKLSTMNADLDKKVTQIHQLNTQIGQLGDHVNNLTNTLSAKNSQLQALDTYCRGQVTSLTDRVHTLETPIGFTVRFSNDSVDEHFHQVGRSYQNLLFDYVQYQTGGTNYNKTTGLFTAPSAGTYAFFISVQRRDADHNDCLEASIMKSSRAGLLATATACPSGYSSASNMGITHLRVGDKVYVRVHHSDRVFGYVHTTFSGLKLTAH